MPKRRNPVALAVARDRRRFHTRVVKNAKRYDRAKAKKAARKETGRLLPFGPGYVGLNPQAATV